MRRPPLVVVIVAVLIIALGESTGAIMSQLRAQVVGYARAASPPMRKPTTRRLRRVRSLPGLT